ncbi:MAG: DUF2157 domain-containing protein [Planctomycetota bacterium]
MKEQPNNKQRSYPKKFYTWLLDEFKDWQDEKLIDDKQAEVLRQRYVLAETALGGSPTHSKLIRILTILGVLLIGAGIIIFFAANWVKMANSLKLGTIFVSLIGSYFLGYYWRYKRGNYPSLGASLIFLGAIIFGAGILLISQIYHLGGKLPDAIMFWGIGTLLMAWVSGLIPILALSSVLFTAWSVLYVSEFTKPVYYYLVFMGLIFLFSYRRLSAFVIVLNILGVGVWLGTLASNWLLSTDPSFHCSYLIFVVLYFIFGILVYVAGYLNYFSLKTIRIAFWYKLLGILTILIILYILSFKGVITDFVYEFSKHPIKSMPNILWCLTILSMVALIIALVNILFRQSRNKSFSYRYPEGYEMLSLVFLLIFLFFTINYPLKIMADSRWYFNSPAITYYAILFNMVSFALIIGTILVGYFNAEPSFIYIGLVFFVINLITRYCEYGWGMMERSLFFIGGGIILLVGGFYLERLRRKLLQRLRNACPTDTGQAGR